MLTAARPHIVDLPDAASEVEFLTHLTCERCNAPVRVQRQGARPIDSGEALLLEGFWKITCTRCHCCKQIITCIVV